jgi:Xaa-Pro aminopeptidase
MPATRDKYAGRISALQRRIRGWKVDALLIVHPVDIRYLTGFVGDDSWALVRARSRRAHVLSDFRFEEQIQREAPQAAAVIRRKSLSEELRKLAGRLKLQRIGVQGQHVTLAQRRQLAKALGAAALKEVDDGLVMQRAVKDAAEARSIRRAIRVAEQAFTAVLATLKPGQTEQQVAARLEYEMRCRGASGASFPIIVAADANASLPHAIPGRKKIRKGGTILFDWGAVVDGYCSDLTRVVALGRMPRRIAEIYDVVLEAQAAAIAAIKPGGALREIDKVARDVIARAGYGRQFGHSLGHGIGLEIHEQPTLASRATGELRPGHVVTVEPGIYLPGVGGVRIEDDVLVDDRGGRVLSSLPKDRASAII